MGHISCTGHLSGLQSLNAVIRGHYDRDNAKQRIWFSVHRRHYFYGFPKYSTHRWSQNFLRFKKHEAVDRNP